MPIQAKVINMRYSFDEIHALNMLSDNPEYSKRFNTPKDLKVITLCILLVLVIVLAVAILFKVDKIVPAKGVLETKAELFVVRNNQQAYIDTVHVQEGDSVQLGDALVTFDTRLLDLDIQGLQQQIESLERSLWADYWQLQVILPTVESDVLVEKLATIAQPAMQPSWQQTLQAPIERALQQNQEAQTDTQLQVRQLIQQLTALEQALQLDQQQLTRINNLYEQEIESRINLEQQQRQVLNSQASVDDIKANIQQRQLQLQRLQTDLSKTTSDLKFDRIERFYNNLDSLQQAKLELAKQTRVRDDMIIVAPIQGTVDGVAIKGQGELLQGNSALVTLRPTFKQDDLLIEIQIPSSFAVWVEQGMAFRASAQGNNPDDHGYINGVVEFVSESTNENQTSGTRTYRMIGKITDFELSTRGLEPAFLRPGMELNVQIKAGKRRLINYVFDPFTKHFRTAFSEPG